MEGLVGMVVFAPSTEGKLFQKWTRVAFSRQKDKRMPCIPPHCPSPSHPHFHPSLIKHENLQATVLQSASRDVGAVTHTHFAPSSWHLVASCGLMFSLPSCLETTPLLSPRPTGHCSHVSVSCPAYLSSPSTCLWKACSGRAKKKKKKS